MTLDWNLMRAVLLAVERGEDPSKTVDAAAGAVEYHLRLLGTDAGNAGWITVPRTAARCLTDQGRMIASLVRDDAVWKHLRAEVRVKADSRFDHIFRAFLATYGHSPLFARREALLLRIPDVVQASGVSMRTVYRCEELNRLPRSANDRAAYLKALMWTEAEARAAIDEAASRIDLGSLMAPRKWDSPSTAKRKRDHAARLKRLGVA